MFLLNSNVEAALAASVFHYKEIEIYKLKNKLSLEGIPVSIKKSFQPVKSCHLQLDWRSRIKYLKRDSLLQGNDKKINNRN